MTAAFPTPDGVPVPAPIAPVTSAARRLATFDGLAWAPGGRVEAWLGEPPADLAVSSACVLVLAGDHLLLVDVRSRGWDVPGGHLDPGESAVQAMLRELEEEAGLAAEDVDPPQPIGWFRLGAQDGWASDGETSDGGASDGGASAMLVFRAGLHPAAVRWLATRVPDEIADVRTFPVDALPDGTADRIWVPYLDVLTRPRPRG